MLPARTVPLAARGRQYTVQTARVPFPGSNRTNAAPTQAVSEQLESTRLEGGVTVLSIEPGAAPAADSSISLYIRAGSRFESRQTAGSAHFLRHVAFKNTNDKSAIRLNRDLDHIGATLGTEASREWLSYHVHGLRATAQGPDALSMSIMAETLRAVTSPTLMEFEVEEVRKIVLREIQRSSGDVKASLIDRLHFEAFGDSGLGNGVNATEWAADQMNSQRLHRHVSEFFYPGERMVLVGLGVEHATLVKAVQGLFVNPALKGQFFELRGASPLPVETTSQTATYTDRASVIRTPTGGNTHVVIGFKGQGRAAARENAALLAFREVLGAGSPDIHNPGMSGNRASRLARNVTGQNAVSSAFAFHHTYSDAGLFGVYAEAAPGNGAAVVKSLQAVIHAASKDLSPEDVIRAKNVLKGNQARALSQRRALADSLAASSFNGTAAAFNTLVDSLSAEDIKRAAQAALASPAIIVAQGDVRGIRL